MEIDYIPTQCKGEDKKFEGTVKIKLPSFDQKYLYMEQSGFSVNEKGEFESGIKQIPAIRKMVSFAKDHIVSVSLKKIPSGVQFKAYDEMIYDGDCDSILIEIAMQLMNGFKVGNG